MHHQATDFEGFTKLSGGSVTYIVRHNDTRAGLYLITKSSELLPLRLAQTTGLSAVGKSWNITCSLAWLGHANWLDFTFRFKDDGTKLVGSRSLHNSEQSSPRRLARDDQSAGSCSTQLEKKGFRSSLLLLTIVPRHTKVLFSDSPGSETWGFVWGRCGDN
jgi:hypothetical protein